MPFVVHVVRQLQNSSCAKLIGNPTTYIIMMRRRTEGASSGCARLGQAASGQAEADRKDGRGEQAAGGGA